MSKKAIISLSIVLGIVAVILILFWTLFALSTVTVNYKTTTINLNVEDEEIVKAGEFQFGACVLFDGKNKYIENINNYVSQNENFAYLEIVNIETVFPNKYVIHIAEREEVFAVSFDGQTLICDDDLRVLKILNEEYESTKENPILLENLEIENQEIKVGTFLEVKEKGVLNLFDAQFVNNRDLKEQKAYFKSITLGTNYVEITDKTYDNITIQTFGGLTYVVNNIDFALAEKFRLLFAIDSAIYLQINEDGQLVDKNGEPVCDFVYDENGEIMKDENGNALKGKIWTYERLKNGYVLIDNNILNDFQEVLPTDIYYKLMDKKIG